MPTTSPDNIYYADGSTPMSAETISAAEATSIQAALNAKINNTRQIQTFVWANTAARNAQTGMAEGDFGYQLDNDLTYRYTGTAWTPSYLTSSARAIPTSVAGTGVAFNSITGVVTLTNATTVTINGVFTSAFRNYRIVYDATGTASTLAMTMRASGVDSATGYDLTELIARNGAVSSATTLNQASWAITGATGGNTVHAGTIDIFVPQVARETRIFSSAGTHGNPAVSSVANALRTNYGTHRPTTAYDGFNLIFSAAVSGTVQVIGLS